MAELVLLLERNLRHRAFELHQPEERIVAESAGPQGRFENLSFHHAFPGGQLDAVAGGGQHAAVARGSLCFAAHAFQEIEVVALIGRVRVRRIVTGILGKARRANARLAAKGDDPEGWRRLIRAYAVLQEQDKAKEALAKARAALDGDDAAKRDLDALAKELGLES